MKTIICCSTVCLFLPALACTSLARADELYFPPMDGEWETVAPADVGWDQAGIQTALEFAGRQQSTGMVILHRGRILAEQYWELTGPSSDRFNERLIGRDAAGHGIEDVASVQKSVTSFLVGIAREKGLLTIDDPVSRHLGEGWSRATPEQESAITIRHLITMTSGLSERGRYEAEPGTQWNYNTAVYARTMNILEAASGMDRHELTETWLTRPIGMSDSRWAERGSKVVRAVNAYGFATTARDLARFGLLMLAGGRWGERVVLADREYLNASTSTSQALNPHYGYLWWVSRNAHEPDAAQTGRGAGGHVFGERRIDPPLLRGPQSQRGGHALGDEPAAGRAFERRFWRLLMEAAPESGSGSTGPQ